MLINMSHFSFLFISWSTPLTIFKNSSLLNIPFSTSNLVRASCEITWDIRRSSKETTSLGSRPIAFVSPHRATVKIKLYRSQDISIGQRYSFPTLEPVYQFHVKVDLFFHCEIYCVLLLISHISKEMLFSPIHQSYGYFFPFH